MSDSELSDAPDVAIPPDSELENSLRREVNRVNQVDGEITLKSIRAASEKKLGLPADFYRNHAVWKDKSKTVIHDQVDTEQEVPNSPQLKSKPEPKPKVTARDESESPRPSKRKSTERQSPATKKRKTKTVDSDAESTPLSNAESLSEPEDKPKKIAKPKKKAVPAPAKRAKPVTDESDEPEDKSESEMSVVLDEEPKPKKRGKAKDPAPKTKQSKAVKPKSTGEDPDQEEVKRLQGWLVRCGIRKVWGAYLKPYETPKAKIKHLKEMLADVGMTGRYSAEKARAIKEERELAAEIEAVQEGEQRWGTGGDQGSDEDGKPKGRLVRGQRAAYDFLSSDGEETS